MKQLIIPSNAKHKYVIGIDFGHGETSAAICELEWDKDASQRESEVLDLDMNRQARKKVIPSAICIANNKIYIGEDAFSHMSENEGLRVSFKKSPESLYGKDEQLMMRFMEEVYSEIRSADDRLTDTNHIVYIARPSGWNDEATKETYRQMALEAGLPLAGLTSESRAAIFYARSPKVNFLNNITKGALVFDLGSSTLDLTYLSNVDNNPIDQGYNDGASKIEEAIYERYIQPETKEFLEEYPIFADALKFRARRCKETAYSKNPDDSTDESFRLRQILPKNSDACQKYGRTEIELYIENIEELNQIIEDQKHYISDIKKHLIEYRDKEIPGRKVYGVLLTGGASRMAFLRPIIAEVFNLDIESQVKYDRDNPSLTISRGIALLGATDAITSVLVSDLKASIPTILDDTKLFDKLVRDLAWTISSKSWEQVELTCNFWIKNGTSTDVKEMKEWVLRDLKSFQTKRLGQVVNTALNDFIREQTERVRKEINAIISRYAPGQEITKTGSVSLADQETVTKTLNELNDVISKIGKDMGDIISDILWKALAVFLWGVFALPYYVLKVLLTSDESKRKDKAENILKKKFEIINNVKDSIQNNLAQNSAFKNQITVAVKSYFDTLIDVNLQQVRIPIE